VFKGDMGLMWLTNAEEKDIKNPTPTTPTTAEEAIQRNLKTANEERATAFAKKNSVGLERKKQDRFEASANRGSFSYCGKMGFLHAGLWLSDDDKKECNKLIEDMLTKKEKERDQPERDLADRILFLARWRCFQQPKKEDETVSQHSARVNEIIPMMAEPNARPPNKLAACYTKPKKFINPGYEYVAGPPRMEQVDTEDCGLTADTSSEESIDGSGSESEGEDEPMSESEREEDAEPGSDDA